MNTEKQNIHTNHLINETSPYLLQHANNPVDWYPWSKETLEKARVEDKMILVSIGYSACHWCHVMEQESFEDEEVARIMNENFICIKVDREERPDVDNIYMDAIHLMGKQGGWPLNCFALPDGRPVFGGTYYTKDNWVQLLLQLNELYVQDKPKMEDYASQLEKGMRQQMLVRTQSNNSVFTEEQLGELVGNWSESIDWKWGGSEGAPKFPMPNGLGFLLQYYYYSNDTLVKDYIELTLDKMAAGGIYDHLGGGFSRYSTDSYWKVPHFEKMLYDNAQLVEVYAQAYKLFKKERYKEVVYETLKFIDRELTHPSGGLYSALDADSEGVEGKFYVWTYEELDNILGENMEIFSKYYSISKSGNWEEGVNILHNNLEVGKLSAKYNLSIEEVEQVLTQSNKKLLREREKRVRPATDTKVLSSWNALAISAYVEAYKAFGEESFLDKALKVAEFFSSTHVYQSGEVLRMKRAKGGDISGFLDDYALMAKAYIDIYEVTFDEQWLKIAKRICDFSIQRFYDEESGLFFYHDIEDTDLFARKQEITDNVIPSSNSSIANVLFRLSQHFEDSTYLEKSEKMMRVVYPSMPANGVYFSNWAILLNELVYSPPELVFVGEFAKKKKAEWDRQFAYATVAGSLTQSDFPLLKNRYDQSRTLMYVCRNKVCKLPVETVEELVIQVNSK